MSVGTKLLQAAAGNAGETVYVDDVFSTFLYEGTNTSTAHQIQNGIDLSGEGGLVWIKKRDSNIANTNHHLVDTERGDYYLASNSSNAQASGSDINTFNSDGWTFDASTGLGTDYLGSDYVSWTFRKQEKFFDIVTYTGNGSNRTISHNLGSVPAMMIVKSSTRVDNWAVYHRGMNGGTNPEQYYMSLNATSPQSQDSYFWNDTAPTSTVFSLGTQDMVNKSGESYVAYIFGHDEQEFGEDLDEAIIKCGSYEGNSQGDASVDQTISLGFEPQWIMIKKYGAATTGRWSIFDNMRGVKAEGSDKHLSADVNNAEESNEGIRFEANGFTLEGGNWNYTDGSTPHKYLYTAIARPHKPASEFSNTDMFKVQYLTAGEGADTFISTGFPVDSVWYRKGTSSSPIIFGDRLRGGDKSGPDLKSFNVDVQGSNSGAFFLDHNDGATVDHSGGHFNASPSATDEQYARYFFRRMRGFYDVVTYNGTDSDRTQAHNLGVAPELIIIKRLGPYNADWVIYSSTLGAGKYLYGDAGAELSSTTVWNNTSPTESVFSLGAISSSYYRTNGSGSTYIAYLYATANGISKVGSYTGTGSDVNVDCGFSAGAKFVFVKRTDSSSSDGWFLWDSGRGIVSGNDPYFIMNTQSTGQVSNTDYIDPLNAGFTITSSAPADLNASGGTYLFYAIA